jgi:hypothetical protein
MAINTAAFKRNAVDLFLISFLSLYFELLIIRWLSSQIRIFAYFKNVPLLAAVFGLGLGLALVNSKRDFAKWFPISTLIISALICFAEPLHLVHFTFMNSAEFYLIGSNTEAFTDVSILQKIGTIIGGLFILVGIFYLLVLMFVGLGQLLGKAFNGFNPLVAYSINVGASFIAILAFSLVSFLSFKPDVWVLIGCTMAVWFFRDWRQLCILAVTVVMTFVTMPKDVYWSPYYRISVDQAWLGQDGAYPPFMMGYGIRVNHDVIEGAYDNRPETVAKLSPKQQKQVLDYYEMFYQIIGDQPKTMLILAAGAGNDMAAALRHGATYIDAVEIDPVIVDFGKKLHPEHPYDNKIVVSIIDDARAFMRRSTKKYDVVDYAYLDSGTAFSSMSSIRLDNYIYTIESFQDAVKLMKPNGILACTFYPTTAWQQVRIFKTMEAALGYEPLGVMSHNGNGLTFVAGGDQKKFRENAIKGHFTLFDKAEISKRMAAELADWNSICPTTDDWPFLFLRQRGFAPSYAGGLIFTLLIGWSLVRKSFGSFTRKPIGLTMFFLGAGFMLVEVKSISQMGLIIGTTWLVNAAVIGAILVMIFFATLGQLKVKAKRVDGLYYALFATLILSYFLPLSLLNTLPVILRVVLGGIVLAMPMFFASWIFAISFTDVEDPQKALGMNLLGTLIGGALEYMSMVFGIAALNLVAVVLYALAFHFYRQQNRLPSPAQPPGLSDAAS